MTSEEILIVIFLFIYLFDSIIHIQLMTDAAKAACEKLLKYYNKTTPLYSIASALDPRINLEYFKREKWEEVYIMEWKSKMKDIWEQEYKPPNMQKASEPLANDRINNEEDFINSIYQKRQRIDMTDELEQ